MRHWISLLVLLLGLAWSGPSLAQLGASELAAGGFYLDVAGQGGYVSVPEAENFVLLGRAGARASSPVNGEDDAWGGGLRGAVGWVLPEGTAPVGSRARVEAGGHYFSADADGATGFSATDTAFLIAIDGTGGSGGPLNSAGVVTTDLEYRALGADLLLRTDFGDPGSVVFSPFVGFSYTRASREEDFRGNALETGPFATHHQLDTDYLGGALGASCGLALGGGLTVGAEVRVDLTRADADLSARQSFFAGSFRVKDGHDAFAARVGGSVGMSRRFGPVVLGVEGFGSWLSWSPYPVYPTAGVPGPVRLDDDDAWNAGGSVRVSVPF